MTRLPAIFLLAMGLLVSQCPLLAQQQQETKLEIEPLRPEGGGLVTDLTTGFTVATNGVLVKYGEAVLTAESATISRSDGRRPSSGQETISSGAQSGESSF